jgi:hypothetical protein
MTNAPLQRTDIGANALDSAALTVNTGAYGPGDVALAPDRPMQRNHMQRPRPEF